MARKTDAIASLKADHRKVEDLFTRYEKARKDEKKQEIVQEICRELSIHATIEEEIFYPACAGFVEEHLLDEAYVEHDGAKTLIAELMSAAEDEFRDAKVAVLREMIKHHVKEEEQRDGIFAQAKKADLELVEPGERMQSRREELEGEFEAETPLPTTRSMVGEAPLRGTIVD
jgi:hemerythrin superfamily protein